MHSFDWRSVRLAGPPRSPRGAETRRRLVLAAAELMAERGIDSVSTAEIAEHAGQRNVSAITYHFGSREAFIIEVVIPRDDVRMPIDEARTRLLDDLLATGRPPTLEEVLGILVRPSVAALASRDARNLLRVAVQLLRLLPLEDRANPQMPWERRLMPLILGLLPHASLEIRRERFGSGITLFYELIAMRAMDIEHGVEHQFDDEAFSAEVVSMLAGLMTAESGVIAPEEPAR